MCAEGARGDTDAFGAQLLHVGQVELLALLRRGGVGEARPVATPGVGVEGELRDGEHLAAHVGQAEVHEAGLVVEDAQPDRLGGELPRRLARVGGSDPDERQEARADGADDLAVDAHRRLLHALHEHAHLLLPRLAGAEHAGAV